MTKDQAKNVLDEADPIGSGHHEIIMDEGDAAEAEYRRGYREGVLAGWKWTWRMMRIIKGYNGKLDLAFDCCLLSHRQYDELGVQDQVALARRHRVTKQAIQKIVDRFEERLGLPGERGLAGRANMKAAREGQLQG